MTDPHDSSRDPSRDIPDITPDLSPEDEAAMRDLLGSLGTEAMPPAVQARLEAAIAEQAGERSGGGAARNVRRLAVAWLGAAAAVFVAMAGVGVVINQTGSGDSADSTSVAQGEAGASAEAQTDSDADTSAPTGEPDPSSDASRLKDGEVQQPSLPVIRPDHLAQDAAALIGAGFAARAVPTPLAGGCVVSRAQRPDRRAFSVSYAGEPAVLIITDGPPRTASVYSCSDELLQSAELPD